MKWPSRRFPIPEGPDAVRINLACGLDYRPGWLNVDVNPTGNLRVDREVDIEDVPWPIESSSADYVLMSHIIEHLRHGFLAGVTRKTLALAREAHETGKWDDGKARAIEALASQDGLMVAMEEIHRVLKPGGIVDVLTPTAGTPETWLHPTHTRAMEPDWWQYFSSESIESRQFYSKARFRLVDQFFEKTVNHRVPFRWLKVTDYHLEKYLGGAGTALKGAIGTRRWHLTRLAAVK